MNPISQLYEYCAKNNFPNPLIDYMSNGPDNQKTWLCKLTFNNNIIHSNNQTTKKLALYEVSEKMLKKIKLEVITQEKITKTVVPLHKRIVILVDLENQKITDFDDNFIYIGFIKKTDPKNLKFLDNWDVANNFLVVPTPRKVLYSIEGSNKELVDHFMTSFIVVLANFLQKNSELLFDIYFLSGDNSSYCTKICYQTFFDMMKITNYRLSNIIHQKYIQLEKN